jgi:hypothetical protein
VLRAKGPRHTKESGVRGKKFNKLTENSMKPGFFLTKLAIFLSRNLQTTTSSLPSPSFRYSALVLSYYRNVTFESTIFFLATSVSSYMV